MNLSQTEENYLKAIYHLSNHGKISVSTNAIAERLDTKAASVSDMIKKLAAKGLIQYVKYQGVQIIETGIKEALKIVRKHRLWEVFLVEKLAFKWDEVHDIAEQLEHIASPTLIQRLDNFLGHPTHDPHGDPIPSVEGIMPKANTNLLIDLNINECATVVGVRDNSTSFLQFLNKIEVCLGTEVCIQTNFDFDGSKEVMINKKQEVILSKEVLQNIYIKPRTAEIKI